MANIFNVDNSQYKVALSPYVEGVSQITNDFDETGQIIEYINYTNQTPEPATKLELTKPSVERPDSIKHLYNVYKPRATMMDKIIPAPSLGTQLKTMPEPINLYRHVSYNIEEFGIDEEEQIPELVRQEHNMIPKLTRHKIADIAPKWRHNSPLKNLSLIDKIELNTRLYKIQKNYNAYINKIAAKARSVVFSDVSYITKYEQLLKNGRKTFAKNLKKCGIHYMYYKGVSDQITELYISFEGFVDGLIQEKTKEVEEYTKQNSITNESLVEA